MRYTWLILVFLITNIDRIQSQGIPLLLQQAQRFEANLKDADAYATYLEILRLQPDHLEALCKASEWGSTLGKRQGQKKIEQEFYRSSYEFAKRAYKLAPNNADANFVMAISKGRMALDASGGEKIQAVKEVKTYAERAIRIDPQNYKAYHVLGKWYYEVSSLNALEKWLVKVTYGGLPTATYHDAARYYEKSRQLRPTLLINYLELARTFIQLEQPSKANNLLKTMLQLPENSLDDPLIKAEGRKLLRSIKTEN